MSDHDDELNEIMEKGGPQYPRHHGMEDCCPPPNKASGHCGSEAEDDNPVHQGYEQWTTGDDKTFVPAARTIQELPPGCYEIMSCPSRGVFFQQIPVRTEGLLRFPQTNSERVIREIQKFWEREKYFRRFGLTYKRGIVLWGPPGSGKSCTIQIIMADVVSRGGVVVKFTHPKLFIEGMRILRQVQARVPVVVLMEDMDSIIEHYSESDVLNILDGVDQVENTVFLACPAPETKILKADLTWVRADLLKEGDELVAFDENGPNRKCRTAVVRSAPLTNRPRFLVTTEDVTITVSEKHPFLVKLGNRPHTWRTVEELTPGTRIAYVGRPWAKDVSYGGGYLAGQLDGEGHLGIEYDTDRGSHGFRVIWTQAEGKVVDNYVWLLGERGFTPLVHRRQPKCVNGPYKPKVTISVKGGKWEQLRLLGTTRPSRLINHPRLRDAWEDCRLGCGYTKVISVKEVERGPVVALDTTTGTFIGEGMLQHNTTNYPERLGPRIINRPSRFDKRFKIDHPNAESRKMYLQHIMRDADDLDVDIDRWVRDTERFSLAHLKELFVAVVILGDDYDKTVKSLQSMKECISSDDDRDRFVGFSHSREDHYAES